MILYILNLIDRTIFICRYQLIACLMKELQYSGKYDQFFMYFCYQVVKSLVNLSSSVMEMNSTLLIAAQRMEQACSRYANSSESCAHLLVLILLLLLQVSLISFIM